MLTTNVDHYFQKAGFDKRRMVVTITENNGWHAAQNRYADFLRRHEGLNILFLELGVGGNTPVIIKYPFWRMTDRNKNATYACINYGEAFAPDEIRKQSICIDADIDKAVAELQSL